MVSTYAAATFKWKLRYHIFSTWAKNASLSQVQQHTGSNTSAHGLNNVGSVHAGVCVYICSEGKREREERVNCSMSTCQADTESFSDPTISRASEDFNVFHSTIKVPVPAGAFSQTVCLRAYVFHITEGYIILSAGIAFHLICLGMEIVSKISTLAHVLAQTMVPSPSP